jgi:hypothetical protein
MVLPYGRRAPFPAARDELDRKRPPAGGSLAIGGEVTLHLTIDPDKIALVPPLAVRGHDETAEPRPSGSVSPVSRVMEYRLTRLSRR